MQLDNFIFCSGITVLLRIILCCRGILAHLSSLRSDPKDQEKPEVIDDAGQMTDSQAGSSKHVSIDAFELDEVNVVGNTPIERCPMGVSAVEGCQGSAPTSRANGEAVYGEDWSVLAESNQTRAHER